MVAVNFESHELFAYFRKWVNFSGEPETLREILRYRSVALTDGGQMHTSSDETRALRGVSMPKGTLQRDKGQAHDEGSSKWEFTPLDKSSFTPMYFQIQSQLLEMIQAGRLRAGDALPSEEELSRIYGVSRMTCRQALQVLKSKGFVSRQKGQGSFVSQPRVEKDIAHLCGFTAEMHAIGLKATSQVLEKDVSAATAEIASRLDIPVNAPVFRLLRLRFADKLPLAIEEIRLPHERFPGVEKLDFSKLSLYQTLRDRYEIRVSRADEILEARSASRREADLLGIQARSSLLAISRTLWSTDGLPVETADSVYRGDRYRAVLSIPATEMK